MKRIFVYLFAIMLIGSAKHSFADETLLKLSNTEKKLSIANPGTFTSIFVSDNAIFYIKYDTKLTVYDINTSQSILELKFSPQNNNNTRFAYLNDIDSTLYFAAGDSVNLYMLKVNLNDQSKFDTLVLGPKYQTMLYYLDYDRNTIYTYQTGFSINEIDLATFSIESAKPALDFVQVNNFAVDDNFNILHLETFDKYLALDFSTLEEYYTLEHPINSYTRLSVSPNGETVALIFNRELGYKESTSTLISIPKKQVLRILPDFRVGASAKFLNDNEIIFNIRDYYTTVYRISDSSFIFTDSYATLIQSIRHNEEMALLSWKYPTTLSIINPYTNSVIKNFYNQYSPLVIIGDTLIVRNSGILEYWNIKTQTRLLDTLCSFGWVTDNNRSVLTLSDGKYTLNKLSDLSVILSDSLPFRYEDYFSVEAVSYDGTKLIGQLGFKFDSIVEYDIRNAKCLDTFAITNHRSILMSDLLFSNTLQYYIDKDNITTIYKLKTNDTLLSIPDAYQIVFSNDDSMIAVIDTNKYFYQVDIATGAKTLAIQLPLYRTFYSFAPQIMISDNKSYAFIPSKSTIDSTRPNAVWIIDLKTNKIAKTILMDASLKLLSESENIFVYGNSNSTYVYSFDLNSSAIHNYAELPHRISIYPQPASEFVTVKSNNGIIKSIRIFDNNGKIILNSDAIGSEILEISTIKMAKGVYHFNLETESSTESGNFVIN